MKDHYEGYWNRAQPPPLADPLYANRLRMLLSLLGSPASGSSSILDCGAGDGRLVEDLRKRGYDASGIEVSERAIELARARNPDARLVQHSLEEFPWPVEAESFDYAVSFEVIEHLFHPAALLEGAATALRGGGHLALTTPYHGLLKNLAVATVAFDRHFDPEGDHIRFFSDRSLRRMLERAGFAIRRFNHFGRAPGIWAGTFVWAQKR